MPDPRIVHVRLRPSPARGVNGLVASIVTAVQLRDRSVSLAQAMGMSGAAFRSYLFTPDDNHAWRAEFPGVEWLSSSLDVENYGVTESLSALLSLDLRTYTDLAPAAFFALVDHELRQGRPVVAGGLGPATYEVIVGLSDGAQSCLLPHVEASDPGLATLGVSADRPADLSVTVLRPGGASKPRHLATFAADALDWAVKHGRTRHELMHREEVFFASGARTLEVAADLLELRCPPVSEPERLAALAAFWCDWATELTRARRCAALYLLAWAEDAAAAGLPVTAGGARRLAEAGHHYRAVHEALTRIAEELPADADQPGATVAALASAPRRREAAQALREVAALERAAIDALERALRP
jgi:hypothetical protein